MDDFGVQRYRYFPGIMDADDERACEEGCEAVSLTGTGDAAFSLYGTDVAAERARRRQRELRMTVRVTRSH